MTKKIENSPRRVAKWWPIADGKRRDNPQSIRRFLFDLIVHDYCKDAAQLETAIAKAIDRIPPNEKRHYHQKINKEWLYQATLGKKIIGYDHIEILARTTGIPTGLILTYTRMSSEFQSEEKTKADKSLRILYALRHAVDRLIAIIETHRAAPDVANMRLTFDDFAAMRSAYSEKFDNVLL